jgi:hypothetical protein
MNFKTAGGAGTGDWDVTGWARMETATRSQIIKFRAVIIPTSIVERIMFVRMRK